MRLLSTDFDGTLISHGSDGRCSAEFAKVLISHKHSGGYWAVNTGRSLWHAIEGIEKFHAPIEPDFLLTNEREIFHRTPEGRWVPEHGWNQGCLKKHEELFVRAHGLFEKIRELTARHPGINLIEENGWPAGVVTLDESVMEEFVLFLDAERPAFPDFSYQRNTIYLRFSHLDYHKGATLKELCRLLAIAREQVFAAGDHYNDIPMLDGDSAAYNCCPANAIPEVRQTVLKAKGYIASSSAADGIAEAWHHFQANPIKK
jgi:hydroxymethylpyrimidine pyrophosphatase-like HAD family hydrolase